MKSEHILIIPDSCRQPEYIGTLPKRRAQSHDVELTTEQRKYGKSIEFNTIS